MSLTGNRLQQVARSRAKSLPGVSNGRPFTKNLDVYKVAGKVFLIVTDAPEGDHPAEDNVDNPAVDNPAELTITLKVEPDRASALRQEHPTITRGRYLNKNHWTSVGAGSGISEQLVEDLVEGSYELVRSSLPAKDQPNDS